MWMVSVSVCVFGCSMLWQLVHCMLSCKHVSMPFTHENSEEERVPSSIHLLTILRVRKKAGNKYLSLDNWQKYDSVLNSAQLVVSMEMMIYGIVTLCGIVLSLLQKCKKKKKTCCGRLLKQVGCKLSLAIDTTSMTQLCSFCKAMRKTTYESSEASKLKILD